MTELTYIRVGDYYIPNLTLPEATNRPFGKYCRMRERHLKENHPALYNALMLSGKLPIHLREIDERRSRKQTFLQRRRRSWSSLPT